MLTNIRPGYSRHNSHLDLHFNVSQRFTALSCCPASFFTLARHSTTLLELSVSHSSIRVRPGQSAESLHDRADVRTAKNTRHHRLYYDPITRAGQIQRLPSISRALFSFLVCEIAELASITVPPRRLLLALTIPLSELSSNVQSSQSVSREARKHHADAFPDQF